jgi:hypothetical protein
MKHTYYQPAEPSRRWRLPEALPGRRILVAIWAWL